MLPMRNGKHLWKCCRTARTKEGFSCLYQMCIRDRLYDDRGLDVLGGSQKLLLPLYHQFHDWIVEYDLEKIDQMFAPAKE